MPGAIRGAAEPASGSPPPVRDIPPIEPRSARNALWLAALIAVSVAVVHLTPLRGYVDEIESGVRPAWLHEVRARADAAGVAAGLGFVSAGSLAVALGVPRLALAFAGGAIFGWLEGAALAQIGTLLGCWTTFAVGRRLGHGVVDAIVARRFPRAKALLDFISRHEIESNLVLRLTPIGNSFATNLLFAISSSSSRTFLAATFLGTLPGTVVVALLGSATTSSELAARLLGGALALAVLGVGVAFWIRKLRGEEGSVEPARTRAPFGLDRVRLAYGLASIALLVPCFWQSRIQAGDLASHSYNAWLAELVRSGRAPGLRVAVQSTNVLFDCVLGALAAQLGPEWAERLAVSLAVLVFAWGAFGFVSAVSGRRAWDLLPCIAMLAYGWVFHIGFFNFYLGLGLSLSALALAWSGAPVRIAAAVPILALAWLAHALPVAWAIALIAFTRIWRSLPPRLRPLATLAAMVLLSASSASVSYLFPTRWSLRQAALVSGADQLRVFDARYDLLAIALLAFWAFAVARSIHGEGARAFLSRLEVQVFALCAVAVLIVPGAILLPGYGHALVYIAERMSLTAAVLACAVVATLGPGRSRLVLPLIALVFFAFLYRDERSLNRFEDRLDEVVTTLAGNPRVILGVRDPGLRVNALAHSIDRACIGRCYSYANYEPSTLQFRVRAEAPNPIVVESYEASRAMQMGGYFVRARDLPLSEIVLASDGSLEVRSLAAGAATSMTLVEILR